jgi:CspA family cold shock protein
VSNRDRDFRPARRRDFADDDYQPPSRNFGYAPPRGPQFDSPTGPPIRAVVKWYSPDKGFGFVELSDGSGDAFLHVSVVERGGHANVPPGATLEVRAGAGPKGQQVTEILSVDTSTALQEQPRRPRPERAAYHPSADRPTVEETGTVKWYNALKGFGFIASDRGGKDIFVHASALERSGIMGLPEGQRVTIDVAHGQKGPEAVNLRLI